MVRHSISGACTGRGNESYFSASEDRDRYYRLKPKVSSTPESRNTHHIARPDVGQPALPEKKTRIIATTVYRLNRPIVLFTSAKLGSSDNDRGPHLN
ncbi:Unsaturated chondroitin disaccharide hydrolase [Fusarium oxysporum f. sp. albedinis]|nr:Unsaturated chondroitin disaccharide hydrolase [Fusarium oxysporum f. sp. albedinis]